MLPRSQSSSCWFMFFFSCLFLHLLFGSLLILAANGDVHISGVEEDVVVLAGDDLIWLEDAKDSFGFYPSKRQLRQL